MWFGGFICAGVYVHEFDLDRLKLTSGVKQTSIPVFISVFLPFFTSSLDSQIETQTIWKHDTCLLQTKQRKMKKSPRLTKTALWLWISGNIYFPFQNWFMRHIENSLLNYFWEKQRESRAEEKESSQQGFMCFQTLMFLPNLHPQLTIYFFLRVQYPHTARVWKSCEVRERNVW